jgi:hypothetical protein
MGVVERVAGPSGTRAVITPAAHLGRSESGHSRTTIPASASGSPASPPGSTGGPPPGQCGLQLESLKAERLSHSGIMRRLGIGRTLVRSIQDMA